MSEKICKDCGVTRLINKREIEKETCETCIMVNDYEEQIKTLKEKNKINFQLVLESAKEIEKLQEDNERKTNALGYYDIDFCLKCGTHFRIGISGGGEVCDRCKALQEEQG